MRIPIFFFLSVIIASCKKESCDSNSCVFEIKRLKVSEKKDGYDIYDIAASFNASKYGSKINPEFDINCDGKIDFLFTSSLIENSSGFKGISSTVTAMNSNSFLFGYISHDTLYNFTDTTVVDDGGSVKVYSTYGTTCSTDGVNILSYSTYNAFRLPYLENYTTSFSGVWESEKVILKNPGDLIFMDKTETPDTTYFDYYKKTEDCWDLNSGISYVLFKVKKNKKETFGFFEMDGPYTIKRVGIKK